MKTGSKRRGRRAGFSFFGYVVYFIAIAAVVTAAFVVYGLISDKGLGKGTISWIMLGSIFFLALLCTGADILRRRLMVERPVKKILNATERIASGDFSVRLEPAHPYFRRDEYDEIMENLNKMTAELAHTEMLHADFISNVSHELKTPVSVIRNYAQALGRECDGELRKKYAAALISAADRLTALVQGVLRLNKLENQKLTPARRTFRLDEMLAEAALAFEDAIDAKGLTLECDLEEAEITSVPDYLELVWNNLLSNAVKFTEQGGITLSLKMRDGNAVVRVADTGQGISPEVGRHIFEKFYQGDTSHAGEGNGLGLALVKKVIDLLGGEIAVESEAGKAA